MKKNLVWASAIAVVALVLFFLFIPTKMGMIGAWDNGSWSVVGATRLCLYPDGTFNSQSRAVMQEGVWSVAGFRLQLEFCRQRDLLSESWTDLYAFKSIPVYKLGPGKLKLGDGSPLQRQEFHPSDERPARLPHWPPSPRHPVIVHGNFRPA